MSPVQLFTTCKLLFPFSRENDPTGNPAHFNFYVAGHKARRADWKSAIQQVGNLRYDRRILRA